MMAEDMAEDVAEDVAEDATEDAAPPSTALESGASFAMLTPSSDHAARSTAEAITPPKKASALKTPQKAVTERAVAPPSHAPSPAPTALESGASFSVLTPPFDHAAAGGSAAEAEAITPPRGPRRQASGSRVVRRQEEPG